MLAALTSFSISAADVFSPGFVKREFYGGISGTTVDLLTTSANYPGSPDTTTYEPGLEMPPNVADNYGVRLSGFVVAQETGNFEFYISADDGAEFWLSTDSTPANLTQLCREPSWNGIREWNTPGSNGGGRDTAAPENKSAAISLVKGSRYYFEALVKEGGGGDNLAVTLAKAGAPTPANGTVPVWGPWVGVNIPSTQVAGAAVQITAQPQSTSVAANEDVTLTAAATGSSPANAAVVYQWLKNGTPVLGEAGASLTLRRVQVADSGTKYSVFAAVAGASVVSSEATLTVTADVTKPTVVSARAGASRRSVTVKFSEWVDAASATTAGNYTLSGGLTVSAATLVNPSTVLLTTSAQTAGASYTLSIANVKDTAGNAVASPTQSTFRAYVDVVGKVLNKFWNFGGNNIAGLRGLATFPDSPDWVRIENTTEYPENGGGEGGSNYGNELTWWWKCPSSGSYVLVCSGDDPVELYLSTDEDPANEKLVAREPSWNNPRFWDGTDRRDGTSPENRSDLFTGTQWLGNNPNDIQLVGGRTYFLRALHTEGGGGDNVGATFVKVGDAFPANGDAPAFAGDSISFRFDPSFSAVAITEQPASKTVFEGRTATVSVGATGGWQFGTSPNYQWQSAPAGGSTFTDIAGATGASYTTDVLGVANSGTQYRVIVSVPGTDPITSSVATVTVNADKVAPVITKVKATSSASLVVQFDESLEKTSAEIASNYTLSSGVTVSKATATDNTVLLTVSGVANKQAYTLTVGGVKDLYGNAVTAGTKFSFTANIVTYRDVILADGPIGLYSFEETTGQKTKNYGTFGAAGDGLYMAGSGPADSVQTDAAVAAGPRPGDNFLGFDPANNAVIMDGANTQLWIDCQNQFLNGLKAFSLEYWVKPANRASDPGAFGNRIGLVGQNDAVEYGFISPGTIQIWTSGGGSLDTGYSFADGEWHHIATIADGKSIKTYYDGKLIGTGGSTTGNYGSSSFNVHIGGGGVYDATGNFFTGQFDEVAIFDKAIPAERIAEHYKAGREGGEAPEPAVQPVVGGITTQGGNVRISYSGVLQSAASINGPWTDVPGAPTGASQIYSAPSSAAQSYFRSRQ